MMKYIWGAAIVLILLSACKKNEPNNLPPTPNAGDFAGTYTSATVAQVVSTKLITAKGSSSDATAINAVLTGLSTNISLTDNSKAIAPGVMILKITPAGEADIDLSTEFSTRITFKGNIQDITTDELIIRNPKVDTTFVPFYSSLFPFAKSISPDNKFIPISTSTGYNNAGYLIGVKKQRLIHKGTDLYLPMLLFCYRFETSVSSERGENVLYNSFNLANPDLNQFLGLNDKVVVQELLIKLNKQ